MIIEHVIGLAILIILIVLTCNAGKIAMNLLKAIKGLFAYGVCMISNDGIHNNQLQESMYQQKEVSDNEIKYKIRFYKVTASQYIDAIRTILQGQKAILIINNKKYELNNFQSNLIEDDEYIGTLIVSKGVND